MGRSSLMDKQWSKDINPFPPSEDAIIESFQVQSVNFGGNWAPFLGFFCSLVIRDLAGIPSFVLIPDRFLWHEY